MQTIIIVLDPKKLANPVTDLAYAVPVEMEKETDDKVSDNGFEYFDDDRMGIWLETENAEEFYPKVIKVMKNKEICGNDLSLTAEVYISKEDCAEFEKCRRVYPV